MLMYDALVCIARTLCEQRHGGKPSITDMCDAAVDAAQLFTWETASTRSAMTVEVVRDLDAMFNPRVKPMHIGSEYLRANYMVSR